MAWSFLHEVGRKAIHLTILIVIAVFFIIKNAFGMQSALIALVALLIVFIVLEYFRLELNMKLPFFQQFVRPKEEFRVYGVIFFLTSSIICLAAFDTSIAIAALLMTTFGDVAAAIAGKKWGTSILFKNKTAVGFAAGLVTNLFVAVAVSLFFVINIYIPIIMAFVASISETLVDELDDNLVVPVFAGFVGQILLLSL